MAGDRPLHLDRRVHRRVAVGKVAMISSPIVLMTVPPCCSVARRMISMQTATLSRAATSPSSSYSRVLPTTSAKRIVEFLFLTHVARGAPGYIIRIIGGKQAGAPRAPPACSTPVPQGGGMALSLETAPAGDLRHLVAQARGRRVLYPDPPRARGRRGIADTCARHGCTASSGA